VIKWDALLQRIAGDILAFVDDLRASGYFQEVAWAVGISWDSGYPAEMEAPSWTPEAWAGAVFSTDEWAKAKLMIWELMDEASRDLNFEYETLLTPFLKGLHLTLASCLPRQDSEGWKLLDQKWFDHIRKLSKEGKLQRRKDRQSAIAEECWAQSPKMQ
jgi:hypothetical protein